MHAVAAVAVVEGKAKGLPRAWQSRELRQSQMLPALKPSRGCGAATRRLSWHWHWPLQAAKIELSIASYPGSEEVNCRAVLNRASETCYQSPERPQGAM